MTPYAALAGRSRAAGPGRVLRRMGAVISALVVVSLPLWLTASPAVAQEPLDCSLPVVDTSGQIDVAAVEAALATVDPAATVVVRSYGSVPQADLVAAIDEVVVACFGDQDAGVRPDVVILGLSVEDRLSDVLVGARWGAAVSDPARLRSEVMGPRFAEGDYTGGLVDAIDEIAVGVAEQLGGPSAGADPSAGDSSQTEQPQIGSAEQPQPQSTVEPAGNGQSPWAIAGGVAGIAGCGGVFVLVSRHRRLTSSRAEFARSSAGPIARLGVLRESDVRLTAQAEGWTKTTTGRTLMTLRGFVREKEAGRAAVDRAAGLLNQTIPDGVDNADQDDIDRARDRIIELSRALDLHDESLDRLAAFGAHIDHLRVALPAKTDLLDQEIDQAMELADQRESEGWTTDPQRGELHRLGDTIDALDFAGLELDLLELSDAVERAEAQLFATNHDLQSLPSRVNSLQEWNAGLEAAAELELRRIDDLRRQFASVAATHAGESWQWAADYPEEAREELEQADQLQDAVISQLIPGHRFDEAGRQLDRAGLHLMTADHLLDQVDDLLVDLERAIEEAPGIVGQCQEVLRDLTDFVGRHRQDLDPQLLARPGDLAGAIDGLHRELAQNKPNYLRVAETGDRVNRQIDQLLTEAKDQHLRTEARRRELRREVARAQRSLSRARRALGWELFTSTDGKALDRLEEHLGRLPQDLEQAIVAAADVADDALRIQERIIARRRRSSVWVGTGGGGWTSGGGGWSGGGSSSSGRGSSAGRSFGGGSSSGGRSFGGGRSSGSF